MDNLQNQKKLGFFELISGSFYNSDAYIQFRKTKTGRTVAFIALFLFIMVFLGTISVSFKLGQLMDKASLGYDKYLPEIRIIDGKVEVDEKVQKKMPIVIKPDKKINSAIIIDTTGKIKNLDGYKAGVLLTKNQLISKQAGTGRETINDLSKIKNFTLNKEVISQWKNKIIPIFFPILLVMWFLWRAFATTLKVLIFSFVGQMISDSKKLDFTYGESANICILALVPPITVMTLLFISGITYKIPGFLSMMLFYGIYIGYIIFAYNGIENTRPIAVSDSINQSSVFENPKINPVTEGENISE